jgi:hypothetical protein
VLNVLITVDTEVYPLLPHWREDHLRRDLERDIYGVTEEGVFGILHQIDVLNAHKLKAVFMVEGLFAEALGLEPLRRIVGEIQAGGHEVQIHIHPEWLAWMPHPPFAPRGRELLRQFTLAEQTQLIQMTGANLQAAGAASLCALRAGDFAANGDTIRALGALKIRFDSSFNQCAVGSFGDLAFDGGLNQPLSEFDVREVPISFWHSRPFPPRHAQICATSAGELAHALWEASERGWNSFVIVSHSFELLKQRRQNVIRPVPDRVVARRFRQLCQFLNKHRDRFRTCGFADLASLPIETSRPPLNGSPWHAAWRLVEQAYRRLP